MNDGYSAFVSQLDDTIAAFPLLYRIIKDGKEILKGVVPIVDKYDKHWEDYEIEIHASENFPNEFPMLFETGGKIPKIADWHVYEDSHSCCVKVKPEELIRCKNGITVIEFINEEVKPYLFNQTHRRVEGFYVNGEYSHGIKGIYEFYSKTLNTGDDIRKTIALMSFVAGNTKPNRTNLCFCNSGIKFRHCHRAAFEKLKHIGDDNLKFHAYSIGKAAGIFK
jgi:hypothetical protein